MLHQSDEYLRVAEDLNAVHNRLPKYDNQAGSAFSAHYGPVANADNGEGQDRPGVSNNKDGFIFLL